MYVFIKSIISHIILFSAIVSGRMDLAGCLLITCFILSFVYFLIHSPKTGLDLLQNSQLKWGCDNFTFVQFEFSKREIKLNFKRCCTRKI